MVTVNLIIMLVRTVIITATSAGCVLLFLKNGNDPRPPPCNSTCSMWFMGKVRGPVLKSYFIKYISNLWFIYCIIAQIVNEEPLSAVNLGIIFTEIHKCNDRDHLCRIRWAWYNVVILHDEQSIILLCNEWSCSILLHIYAIACI